uniref:Uncharacterized protein n=1 Tax=Aotus nancymaae TaxID=37293 RepID=A0A2K5EZW7_AOTNA
MSTRQLMISVTLPDSPFHKEVTYLLISTLPSISNNTILTPLLGVKRLEVFNLTEPTFPYL